MKSLIEKLEKCFSVFMGEKVKSLSRAIDISPAFKTFVKKSGIFWLSQQ